MKTLNRLVCTFFVMIAILSLSGCVARNKQGGQRKQQKKRHLHTSEETPRKRIKDMSVEEAIIAAQFYERISNNDLLVAAYQHIIAKSQQEPEIAAPYQIKLADFYLGTNDWAEAKKQYKKVIALYPGCRDIERARYREIIAHFWSSLDPARDQAITRLTIQLGKAYLTDFPDKTDTIERVSGMIATSYRKLLESNLLIATNYAKKYILDPSNPKPLFAAAQRLSVIRTEVLPDMQLFVSEITPLMPELEIPEEVVKDADTPDKYARLLALIATKLELLKQIVQQAPAHTQKKLDAADLRDRF